MSRAIFCAAGIAALLAATPAFAATWLWDGGAGGGNQWTNTLNWNPDTQPANNGTADLIFGGITRLTPDMNANWSVNSVTFNNTAGAFQLQSLVGSTLIVGAGGITNNDTDNQVINQAITLIAAQTWNAAAGLLYIAGAVNNNGNLLTIDAALEESVFINGALSGSGGLTKNGLGVLQLQNGKTYTGTTTINAGIIIIDSVTANAGVVTIPGALNIGDGVGPGIDTLYNGHSERVANGATVSIFSTGAWGIFDSFGPAALIETITNLNIVSTGIFGGGLVNIENGSVLSVLGTVTMTGGTVMTANGGGTLRLNGGLTTNSSSVVASISTQLDLNGAARTFTIADGAVLNDLDVTGVVSNGAIIKNGLGALRLGVANTYAGGTTLNAGTILLGHDAALGTAPLIGAGGTLQADGTARTISNTLSGSFSVDGALDLKLNSPLSSGNITKNGAGTLIFAQAVSFTGMTVNAGAARLDASVTFTGGLTNSATLLVGAQTLSVTGGTLANNGAVDLAGGIITGTATLVNNSGGTVSGQGTIANALTNAAGGELRADPGKTLTFTGNGNTNAGQIRLLGGALDFQAALANQAGAFISGNGSLLTGGLTNHGTMNFAGTANLVGDVTNSATGKVISGGGGATIFYDDVTNNGEIRTSINGFTVFFGDVTGGGMFTGTGTVNFEGDLSPGNSPAAVSFAGSVGFGPDATLGIELGGTTPGTQYDRLVIAGSASLDGTLDVSLINGFTPSGGQQFTILTAGSIIDNGFVLGGSAASSFSLFVNGTSVILQAIGLAGDYNGNGTVDAADYVLWRNGGPLANEVDNPGVVNAADYTAWRARFGNSGSGSGLGVANAPVPEPSSCVLLMIMGWAFVVAGGKRV